MDTVVDVAAVLADNVAASVAERTCLADRIVDTVVVAAGGDLDVEMDSNFDDLEAPHPAVAGNGLC